MDDSDRYSPIFSANKSVFALSSPVGLVAGNGSLPLAFVQRLRDAGLQAVVVAHIDETDPGIERLAVKTRWIKVGQVKKLLTFLRENGVREVAFAGGIRRPKLFRNLALDSLGLSIVARARSVKDDVILRAVATELESRGLSVISPSVVLTDFVAPPGLMTSRDLSTEELQQARIGWEAAAAVGKLDIGQAVAVGGGIVVAVEAVEGTDAMIRRAGELTKGGFVVVKRAKPQQDLRLDLPTVGAVTISALADAGGTALVLEAGKAFLLDPTEISRLANGRKIAIRVFEDM